MAHFAQVIDDIVEQVIVAEQDFIDGLPDSSNWIQCSYNTRGGIHYVADSDPKTASADQSKALRKNFPGLGWQYDSVNDAFVAPQAFSTWVLNTTTFLWEPPVPFPDDYKPHLYRYDDSTSSFVSIDYDDGGTY